MTALARVPAADLDERIAAAFSESIESADVADLIAEVEAAAAFSGDAAERARARALDPALSTADVATARCEMEDAAFRRDRMPDYLGICQYRAKTNSECEAVEITTFHVIVTPTSGWSYDQPVSRYS